MFEIKAVAPGVELSGVPLRVFEVLAKYTEFPWPILQVQCKRKGIDPTALTEADLALLVDQLASSVQRFSSPAKGENVRFELSVLVRELKRKHGSPG